MKLMSGILGMFGKKKKEAPDEINDINDKISKLNDTISALEQDSRRCTQLKRELKKSYDKILKIRHKNLHGNGDDDNNNNNNNNDNFFNLKNLEKLYTNIVPLNDSKLNLNVYGDNATDDTNENGGNNNVKTIN